MGGTKENREFRWKQCLVIRGDIRMSCGKISAQAAHAAVAAFERCDRETRERWLTEVPPGTTTALGLGPAKAEDMDRITSDLPLL